MKIRLMCVCVCVLESSKIFQETGKVPLEDSHIQKPFYYPFGLCVSSFLFSGTSKSFYSIRDEYDATMCFVLVEKA